MANKRNLKQTINYVCGELFAETVATSLYGTNEHKEVIEALLSSIILLRNDFVKRISHPEPGMPQKEYYSRLIKDFNDRASEIVDQITSLA